MLDVAAQLAALPLFAGLLPAQVRAASGLWEGRRLENGEPLWWHGAVAEELAVYVVEGSVAINEEFVDAGVLAVLESGASGRVAADTQARIMFAGGDALTGERIIWWNFVSSSRERLERAKEDWREKRFDAVPGETDFIPLPER